MWLTIVTNVFTNYDKYRKYIWSFIFIVLLCLSYAFAYHCGKVSAKNKYEQEYQKELVEKLKQKDEKNKEDIRKIQDGIGKEESIKVVYRDRIKTVKEIVKADNFKCEMTDEQIKILNSYKKDS